MSPIAAQGDTDEFFQSATTIIESQNQGNLAMVLIEGGEVAKEYYSSSNENVNKDTLFATASMSKWITATAVMNLYQTGEVDLDAPVSNYLTRWQLPESEFDNDQVTIRALLSHTAGFLDGLGFGDFTVDEQLPSLEESLQSPRASSERTVDIVVQQQPGSEFVYSGGSYLILELVVEEVSGQSFEEYVEQTFFEPLGMSRSTYNYLGSFNNIAGSYDNSGRVAPIFKYASSAATGFTTSSDDLVKFVQSQIPNSNTANILDRQTLQIMREPHGRTAGFDVWGLGTILYTNTANDDFVFGHDGGNDPAINTAARINPDNGDAIIVLETGHPSLATNIGSQWVLWQTGYPDTLDSDATIESMTMPILIGLLVILFASILVGFKHRNSR